MKVPPVVDRPQMICREHLLEAFERGDHRAGRGLRVETIGAAPPRVRVPVERRGVLVGSEHFHAGTAADFAREVLAADDALLAADAACRDQIGPRGVALAEDVDVPSLQLGRRQLVAGDRPDEDARMIPQPQKLIPPRPADQIDILRRGHAAIPLIHGLAEILLVLPVTAPADHHEDAVPVAKVVERRVLAPDALATDAVEIHVPDVLHLGLEGLGGVRQEQIVRPAGPFDEHLPAVDLEPAMPFRRPVVRHFADAEPDGREASDICESTTNRSSSSYNSGLAQIVRPPEARVRDAKLRMLVRRQRDPSGLPRLQLHVLAETNPFDGAVETSRHRLGRCDSRDRP